MDCYDSFVDFRIPCGIRSASMLQFSSFALAICYQKAGTQIEFNTVLFLLSPSACHKCQSLTVIYPPVLNNETRTNED